MTTHPLITESFQRGIDWMQEQLRALGIEVDQAESYEVNEDGISEVGVQVSNQEATLCWGIATWNGGLFNCLQIVDFNGWMGAIFYTPGDVTADTNATVLHAHWACTVTSEALPAVVHNIGKYCEPDKVAETDDEATARTWVKAFVKAFEQHVTVY